MGATTIKLEHTAQAETVRSRIRADYLEMPDLCVTVEEGARFWHVDSEICRQALVQLAREGFIVCRGRKFARR